MSATGDFAASLVATAAAGEAAIVTGNTGDIFLLPGTGQPVRLPALIAGVHAAAGRAPIVYSPGAGSHAVAPPGHQPVSIAFPPRDATPGDAIPALLQRVTNHLSPIVLILDHVELVVPDLGAGSTPSFEQAVVLESLQQCGIDPAFDTGGHALVLIARTCGVHRAIVGASGFRSLRIATPDADDLEAGARVLELRAASDPKRFASLAPDVTIEAAAREEHGLQLDDLVRASRESAAGGINVSLADLRRRKVASIERQARQTLRLQPQGRKFERDAAVPANVRRLMKERKRSGHWPPSLLLAGPPGLGKTFLVRGIGAELGWPVVSFHLVRSPWVGETESNTALALGTIAEIAPVVVHLDEADRSSGQRSTGGSADGGTSERFQAALWEFTGEGTRPGVLFCLTTNRSDLLDSADRSRTQVIPLIHPTPREVTDLLPVLTKQLGRTLGPDVDLATIAAHPKLTMTSARHLLRILERAATLTDVASDIPSAPIEMAELLAALEDYLAHTDEVEEELMALSALSRTSFRSLLPWVAAEEEGLPREVPPYVATVLDGDGELDQQLLRNRVEELTDMLAVRRSRRQW